ncbi:MAG: dihydropteroate synthase [Chloroflexota bacterium]|nr:MAG: dihydropteroate synthase [Chloroflexota bacterium]
MRPGHFGVLRTDRLAKMNDSPNVSYPPTRCGTRELVWGTRTYIMGIINMTPDSFSGDGLADDVEAALRLARGMVAQGADIVDLGGESTRPGHTAVSVDEELRRVVPAVRRLSRELPVPISIDTSKAEVARQSLEAGASMVNDVWGLTRDPDIAAVAARHGVPVVLMHNQETTQYQDVVQDVIAWLRERVRLALAAGIAAHNIVVDPGIGFGKTPQQNLEVLRRLSELKTIGHPILLGTSRKSTIGKLLNLPPDERIEGTAATVAIGIANGADIVRVHDVQEMCRVARVSDAIVRWR